MLRKRESGPAIRCVSTRRRTLWKTSIKVGVDDGIGHEQYRVMKHHSSTSARRLMPWWFPNLCLATIFTCLIAHAFLQGPTVMYLPGTTTWFVVTLVTHIPYMITMVFLIAGIVEHVGFLFSGCAQSKAGRLPDELPLICVQLPMYNEHAVAQRAIEASCALDWPKHKLEIQVLDDSTDDDTRSLVQDVCGSMMANGHDCRLVPIASLAKDEVTFVTSPSSSQLPSPVGNAFRKSSISSTPTGRPKKNLSASIPADCMHWTVTEE